ncbi:MAG: hypothetical protein ABIR94_11830 [Rubrivivax sp.]
MKLLMHRTAVRAWSWKGEKFYFQPTGRSIMFSMAARRKLAVAHPPTACSGIRVTNPADDTAVPASKNRTTSTRSVCTWGWKSPTRSPLMENVDRSVVLAALSVLAGCSVNPPLPAMAPQADILLIVVGGNSEAGNETKGMRKLYFGHDKVQESPIVETLTKTDGDRRSIAVRYFSWTGDNEGNRDWRPGHPNWIFGGSTYIRQAVPELAAVPQSYRRLVIAGWSNGGATAYELACSLTNSSPDAVSMLITLDPVAWTTQTCKDMTGTPRRPARKWINVYTASGPGNRWRTTNIIAFFGRAWDEHFPAGADIRANNADQLLPDTDHGDTDQMWAKVVVPDPDLAAWLAAK